MAVIFLSIDVTIHDHEEKVKKLVHLKTPAPPVQNLKWKKTNGEMMSWEKKKW